MTSICIFVFLKVLQKIFRLCGGLKWFQESAALSFYRLSYTERMSIICLYFQSTYHAVGHLTIYIYIYIYIYAYIRSIICVESVDYISNSESRKQIKMRKVK
jgi:hypothetical protein